MKQTKSKPKYRPGQVIKEFRAADKKVIIRLLKPTDAKDALSFINALIDEKAKIVWQKPFTIKEERKWLKETIEKNNNGVSVHIAVEIDGKLIGTCGIEKQQGHALSHIGDIGITLAKEYRNVGIGKEAIKTLLEIGRDVLKCKISTLDCYSNNEHAMHVYEKMGFIEYGRLPMGVNYYGDYVDKVLMYRKLV
jgi:RimJ/RimL family protein N-acetyltransferase